jgi:hypothetical protein
VLATHTLTAQPAACTAWHSKAVHRRYFATALKVVYRSTASSSLCASLACHSCNSAVGPTRYWAGWSSKWFCMIHELRSRLTSLQPRHWWRYHQLPGYDDHLHFLLARLQGSRCGQKYICIQRLFPAIQRKWRSASWASNLTNKSTRLTLDLGG